MKFIFVCIAFLFFIVGCGKGLPGSLPANEKILSSFNERTDDYFYFVDFCVNKSDVDFVEYIPADGVAVFRGRGDGYIDYDAVLGGLFDGIGVVQVNCIRRHDGGGAVLSTVEFSIFNYKFGVRARFKSIIYDLGENEGWVVDRRHRGELFDVDGYRGWYLRVPKE